MGGGGGDGGYSERQAEMERRKQEARSALNVLFGVAPTAATTVDRSRFYTPGYSNISDSGQVDVPGSFDQAGYDAALAAVSGQGDEAARNKAALDSLYGGVRKNAFDAGKRRLDEQRGTASRDLKFELFARGLDGGSVDVDQNALVGRVYGQGLTDLGARADATATQLRTGDEQTRVSLLQSIDNGMDQGSAISSALTQMRNNADRAASEATGTSLGDLFADAGLLYQQGRRARGEQSAMDMARQAGLRSPSRAPVSVARGTTTFAG